MRAGARHKKSVRPKPKAKKLYRPPRSIPFPQARGKTLAQVYLTAEPHLNSVTLSFNDNTELVVEIEPCLAFSAEYSEWKTGNQRVLKRWPARSGA